MIWLVWRQHRRQALFAVLGLLALAAFVVPSGLGMRRSYDDLGLGCIQAAGDGDLPGTCLDAIRTFTSQYSIEGSLSILLMFVPMLIGIFWGAPLVARELEHGTHRLVWTQGVSRRQWAVAKFGLVGGFTLLVALVFGFGVSWWMAPLNTAGIPRFDVFNFDVGGLAPVGYTLFALALGIVGGSLWRKVLPAMAASLVVFIGVRVAVTAFARPHFAAPVERGTSVEVLDTGVDPLAGDWVQGMEVRAADGSLLMDHASTVCNPGADDCGSMTGAVNWVMYQPGDRYWMFQLIETGIYVALAGVLLWFAFRRVRQLA
ncbi:ABC transporter permease subunit [Nakamurella sp. YIM 132087]|uniref:ABC transporter permease subunit n=1 Tax=Nakamurella alba TaxID=2665158 RepID=A0A7K1FKZ9_9ACTN|nr:ABC transporter permease [Nakamurella alba]MTD13554.1 ABC transporter permease subunit [Nakamurella alba]